MREVGLYVKQNNYNNEKKVDQSYSYFEFEVKFYIPALQTALHYRL